MLVERGADVEAADDGETPFAAVPNAVQWVRMKGSHSGMPVMALRRNDDTTVLLAH